LRLIEHGTRDWRIGCRDPTGQDDRRPRGRRYRRYS
jgi:hypothetical protein